MTVSRLHKRLDALQGPEAHKPWCMVIADDGEDDDAAIARHAAAGECKPDSGGHMLLRFVDPPKHSGSIAPSVSAGDR